MIHLRLVGVVLGAVFALAAPARGDEDGPSLPTLPPVLSPRVQSPPPLEAPQPDKDKESEKEDEKEKKEEKKDKEEKEKEKEEKEEPAKEEDSEPVLKFSWRDGVVGQTPEKDFRFHLGASVQYDNGFYDVPERIQRDLSEPLRDGSAIRRGIVRFDGRMWENTLFHFEFDVAGGDDFRRFHDDPVPRVFIRDAWLGFADLPLIGTAQVGHQKELITFSNATSSRFLPFIERPYAYDAFQDDFQWGNGMSLSQSYLDQRATSWVGFFRTDTRTASFGVGHDYAVGTRLTFLPVYDEEAQRWLNVSLAGTLRALPEDEEETTVRPLVRGGASFQVPALLDTGRFFGRDGMRVGEVGLHGAWGPWTFGGEYLVQLVPNAFLGGLPGPGGVLPAGVRPAGDVYFQGYYLEVLYFLTPGDHRRINRERPGYDRVVPVRNFSLKRDPEYGCTRGWGAWEVGLRYNFVDLNSGPLQVGTLSSVTLGLNWHLNPNARVLMNYVRTFRKTPAVSGSIDEFGMRFAFDF